MDQTVRYMVDITSDSLVKKFFGADCGIEQIKVISKKFNSDIEPWNELLDSYNELGRICYAEVNSLFYPGGNQNEEFEVVTQVNEDLGRMTMAILTDKKKTLTSKIFHFDNVDNIQEMIESKSTEYDDEDEKYFIDTDYFISH